MRLFSVALCFRFFPFPSIAAPIVSDTRPAAVAYAAGIDPYQTHMYGTDRDESGLVLDIHAGWTDRSREFLASLTD